MAVSFTPGNDFIIPTEDGQTYLGGAGNDTYILSPTTIVAGATIVLQDTEGTNKIQLVDGMEITSSLVTSNAVELTLSNGAKVQILGAPAFVFEPSGNALAGVVGVEKTFTEFVETTLGTTVPAPGEAPSAGGEVVIGEDPSEPTYTLTADAESVDEGATASFTLTTENVEEGTEVAYTISGVDAADVDGALTGVAVVGADGTATIEVALLADATTEGEETLTVSIDGTDATADVTVNDTSLDPEDTFTLAEAVALGEDLPEEYTIQDVPANLFDGEGFAEGAEAILDGAAAIDVTEDMTVAQYDLIDGLATFDVANLAYSIADTWDNLWQRINDPVLEKVGLDYEITEPEGYDFGEISAEEEAFIQGASNYAEGYWNYFLDPITMTFDSLAEATAWVQEQWEAGQEPEWGTYRINDTMDNLLNGNMQDTFTINGSGEVNATGDSTVAQIQQFQDFYGWEDGEGNVHSMLNEYSLADTAANLLNEDNAAIVDGAQEIGLSEAVTVAEYNDLVAQFDQEFGYALADTLENLLAADEGVVAGAEEYSLTDDVASFEGLAVADALSAEELAILDGAANRADYTYSFVGALADLAAAEEGVVDGADEYTLTDAAGAFEDLAVVDILDEVEAGILNGAENAADYTYTLADTADAFFTNGELNEGLAELLPLASAVEVTTEVTTAQYDDMIAVFPDAVFAGGLPGNDFTLVADGAIITTVDNENVTPSDKFAGDGNDTFTVISGVETFRIDGAGATDTLNIRATDDIDPILVENVEVVNVDARAANTQVDGSVFFGVEEWWSNASRENLTINDVAALATVGMKGSHGIAGGAEATLTVNFDVDVTAVEDELDVVFDTVSVRPTSDGAELVVDGFETFNIMNTGTSTVANVTGDELEALNIMGTGNLTLASDRAAINSVDATGFTGTDLSVDVSASTQNDLNVMMGNSNSILTVAGARLAAANTDLALDLGEGENTLAVTGIVAHANINTLDFDAGTLAGVNTLVISNNGAGGNITLAGAATLDLEGIAPDTVVFAEGDAVALGGNTLTFDNEQATLAVVFEDTVDNGTLAFSTDVTDLTINNEDTVGAGTVVVVTATRVTDLTLNADDDAEYGNITTVDNTTAAASNVLTVNTDGDGDIEGVLVVDGNLNGIVLNNEGAGDRDFGLSAAGDLKTVAGANQAAGEGVEVAGDGEGEVQIGAVGATLNLLAIDATEYAGTVVAAISDTASVDARNFNGVDIIRGAADLAANAVTRIQADTLVEFTAAQTGTVTLQNAAEGAMDVQVTGAVNVNNLAVQNATELTVTSTGGNTIVADIQSTMALPNSTAQLETINLMATAGANLTVTDISLNTATGADVALNVNLVGDGANIVTVADISVDAGANDIEALTIDSSGGTGTNVVTAITALADAAFETLTITGDQDVTFTTLAIGNNAAQDLTFDASLFTGETLTATITVGITNNNGNEHTVKLGAGDADITLTDRSAGANNASGNDNNDYFVFEFVGDNIGDVDITDFVTNADVGVAADTADNHDVLDLSEFGITALADLDLAVVGGNLEITAGDGEFDGTITLVGVGATGDVTADNFIFAA